MINIVGGSGVQTSGSFFSEKITISWAWQPIEYLTKENFVPCIVTDGEMRTGVYTYDLICIFLDLPLTHYLPMPDLPGHKGEVVEAGGIKWELNIPLKLSTGEDTNE